MDYFRQILGIFIPPFGIFNFKYSRLDILKDSRDFR